MIAIRCVLCRTCANSKGRIGALERRRLERTCGAGLHVPEDLFGCKCYIAAPLPVPQALRAKAGDGRHSKP